MLGTKSLQSLQTPTSQLLKATSHLQKVDLFNIKLQHQPINDYHSIIKYKPLVVKKEQNWRQCIMSIHSSPQNLIKKPKKNTMITKKKPQLLYSSIKENLWKQKEKEKKHLNISRGVDYTTIALFCLNFFFLGSWLLSLPSTLDWLNLKVLATFSVEKETPFWPLCLSLSLILLLVLRLNSSAVEQETNRGLKTRWMKLDMLSTGRSGPS